MYYVNYNKYYVYRVEEVVTVSQTYVHSDPRLLSKALWKLWGETVLLLKTHWEYAMIHFTHIIWMSRWNISAHNEIIPQD